MVPNKSTDTFTKLSQIEEEPAKLKKVSDLDSYVSFNYGDLVICSANEGHLKELAELWANLAALQQLTAPQRYDFKLEEKNWQAFVTKKLNKKNNLLLVAHKIEEKEVRGFLYLQTITIPSSDLVLKAVIEDVYTKPQYRKQGIALKLLEVAATWAKKENIKQVDFVCLTKLKDSINLYESFSESLGKALNLELVTI